MNFPKSLNRITAGWVKFPLSVMLSLSAFSAQADRELSYEYAEVVDSTPIVKHVRVATPREECWEEEVTYRAEGPDTGLGTVMGAVIGGAIGNAVGHKKRNKQVGAVVGAVLGGTIGHSVAKDRHRGGVETETEEVCRVYKDYHEEERIVGYKVRYEYNNEVYTTRTKTEPGDTIKLRVAVTPVI